MSKEKCIACNSDVTLEPGIKGYKDHVCNATGMIGWRCDNCGKTFHSENKYGHWGDPMRCPECDSIDITTPS